MRYPPHYATRDEAIEVAGLDTVIRAEQDNDVGLYDVFSDFDLALYTGQATRRANGGHTTIKVVYEQKLSDIDAAKERIEADWQTSDATILNELDWTIAGYFID